MPRGRSRSTTNAGLAGPRQTAAMAENGGRPRAWRVARSPPPGESHGIGTESGLHHRVNGGPGSGPPAGRPWSARPSGGRPERARRSGPAPRPGSGVRAAPGRSPGTRHTERGGHRLVQRSFGPDHDARRGRLAGELVHRLAGQGLQFLPDPAHAKAQPLHPGGPAGQGGGHRAVGAAAPAVQPSGRRLLHRRAAPLAAGQLAAGGARRQPGAPGAVEHTHHPGLRPVHRTIEGTTRSLNSPTPHRVLAPPIDDVDERPPAAFLGGRHGDQGGPTPGPPTSGRARADAGHPRPAGPFDDDVARATPAPAPPSTPRRARRPSPPPPGRAPAPRPRPGRPRRSRPRPRPSRTGRVHAPPNRSASRRAPPHRRRPPDRPRPARRGTGRWPAAAARPLPLRPGPRGRPGPAASPARPGVEGSAAARRVAGPGR